LEILNRSDYKNTVHGSDKVYYGGYPYRVKLRDNEITADWKVTADVLSWKGTSSGDAWDRKFGTKSVNNWTKNYYFTGKALLDSFVNHIGHDNVDHISGPISDYHVDMLKKVQKQNKYGGYVHIIKGNKYFNQYDMKLIWKYPKRQENRTGGRLSTGTYGYAQTYPRINAEYYDKLGKSIMGVCDSRYYDCNVYFNKEDLEDIEFFCKLKYGDVISSKVEIIVIDNL